MAAPTASVVNLGCRVNRVEADRIAEDLERAGWRLTSPEEAELVVVNSCAVTGEAEAKTRKAVRRALAAPRSPHVVVTGCAANLDPDEFTRLSPKVVVEPLKTRVAARALAALGEGAQGVQGAGPRPLDAPSAGRGGGASRTRRGIKIQDGCNNRCSYCIVWKARGRERSELLDEVLAQVEAAAAAGVPEVVLTGVNLAAYRFERPDGGRGGLVELLDLILSRTAVAQVRLSSLEPMDVDSALARLMAASGGRIAPYLHLPLQSGCTATLSRMRRPYTAEGFAATVAALRAELPALSVSCDVIVGFPGETEAEFDESCALCEQVGFSRLHVFRYSPRPGTPAADAPDQVPPEVKAARGRRLRELGGALALADARARVGSCERAVLEDGAQGTLGSFHRVAVEGVPPLEAGSLPLVNVAIMGVEADGLVRARYVSQVEVPVRGRQEGDSWIPPK